MAEDEDGDGRGVLDDVGVGEDVSGGVDDDSGTNALLPCDVGCLAGVGVLHGGETTDLDGDDGDSYARSEGLEFGVKPEERVARGFLHGLGSLGGSGLDGGNGGDDTREQKSDGN
jgi:hypothetical protein